MLELLNNSTQTMSSREIAELTGKTHAHVLRDCDVLNESYDKLQKTKIGCSFVIRYLPNGGSKKEPVYDLTKSQTVDLITGYSTELRIKINHRWAELEEKEKTSLPQDYLSALKALVVSEEAKQLAEHKVKELKPKADVYDSISNADNLTDMGKTAKILGIGRTTFFSVLRGDKILMGNNIPYQKYIDAGYFEVKVKEILKGDFHDAYSQTFVTGKGLTWLSSKYGKVKN